MKVFVVGGNTTYVNFISNVDITNNLEEARLVVFTGGEDVTPSFYGCKAYPSTCNNPERDKFEKQIFDKIDPERQVVYGCCRGSQFVCVMNGGKLIQDVTRHAICETHPITDGKYVYDITSTHHQMQYPFNLKSPEDYRILYSSLENRSTHYKGDGIDPTLIKVEPEIVLYTVKGKPKCLAVQGHPEMIPESHAAKMIDKLIQKLANEIK